MRTLFDTVPKIDGLRYEPELISRDEERQLVAAIETLPFGTVVFRGVEARRRVVQFGWDYEFGSRTATPADPIPAFLLPLRARVGEFTQIDPDRFEEVLVTEYQPGAAIGWHCDAPPFGVIAGVSLVSSVRLRLRPRGGGRGDTVSLELEPRSVYQLAGAARSDWEHSIPPARELRYSITFRTIRAQE